MFFAIEVIIVCIMMKFIQHEAIRVIITTMSTILCITPFQLIEFIVKQAFGIHLPELFIASIKNIGFGLVAYDYWYWRTEKMNLKKCVGISLFVAVFHFSIQSLFISAFNSDNIYSAYQFFRYSWLRGIPLVDLFMSIVPMLIVSILLVSARKSKRNLLGTINVK